MGFFGVKATTSFTAAVSPSITASACFSGRSTSSGALPVLQQLL